MKRSFTQGILLVLGLLVLPIACSQKIAVTAPPIRVQVERATRSTGVESFTYSGTIEAFETKPLSFAVAGTVARVLVYEGDYVRKGQLLAELNDATMRNALEMAEAGLQRAEDAYNRLKPMHDKGSLPEIKFVEAETGLQQAKASAAIARKNHSDCKLYSPVDGFVGARTIEPGMNVVPGVNALSILNIDSVYARIAVSEREIARTVKGHIASVKVGALGGTTTTGVIHELGVQADPIAHTYKVKILLPNRDHALKPGMICDAGIPIEGSTNGVVLSSEAIRVDEKGRTFVFALDEAGRRATRRYIEGVQLLNDAVAVRAGLSEGQLVVVAGQQKLVDGCLVEIFER